MHIVIIILLIISFIINILFIRMILKYGKNWLDLREDFNKHMLELYNMLNNNV